MIETLVSVPPQLDAWLRAETRRCPSPFATLASYVASDPRGARLGSGGGTVNLLHRAWLDGGKEIPLEQWIRAAQRLVLHAGGESRRLPAYAAIGKALLPVPFQVPGKPARFDRVLSDFQLPTYREVLHEAGAKAAMLVASGDVWLDLDTLELPQVSADVCGIGMRVSAEVAQHFGVFFVRKGSAGASSTGAKEQAVSFFLQKPSPEQIYRHSAAYDFFVDTGLWLFSAEGVEFLFRRCGWQPQRARFVGGAPAYLDLYTEIGRALGKDTATPANLRQLGWAQLTRSVIPLEAARFFHVGSSRQLLESYEQLAAQRVERGRVFSFGSRTGNLTNRPSLPVWIDGAISPTRWTLQGANVVTGSSAANGTLHLNQEQCVELVPARKGGLVLRPYLLDDSHRGAANSTGKICGQPAAQWLSRRGFQVTGEDVFSLRIYPILPDERVTQAHLDWFFADHPSPDVTAEMAALTKVSAAAIPDLVDYDRYFADRAKGHAGVIREQFEACLGSGDDRAFSQDFCAIAALARRFPKLRQWILQRAPEILERLTRPEHRSRLLMLQAELTNRVRDKNAFSQAAYTSLQQSVLSSEPFPRSDPRLALKDDQIVWGRSPVRLDLAGGWTDTPPYCLEHGGAVLNVAVLLNGQPPIQVFVRSLPEPRLSLRSIDLGSAEVVESYKALATFRDPRSGFSLPKAALAMAGFHPDFAAGRPVSTLRERLRRFGGGLEISLLSAVPKGSGLGTSSILAATILGALNRACALGWDEVGLYNRVLGVEQLLTTGGGWQDQAGALFRGLKLVETAKGPAQTPTVRYLPSHLFGSDYANRTLLLYYTGITRLAKGILKEIVQDMFLGRFDTLQTLGLIRANAHALFKAVQQNDEGAVRRCVARSWTLNKRLDPGTSSPAIESILDRCGADLAAAKLLGAGGGGYMLLCAKDAESGRRIREKLEESPPNRRARFIDFKIAETALEVTVS